MSSITDSELLQIVQAIRSVSTYDFSEYSDKSLKRRFIKILVDYRITVSDLIRQLRYDFRFAEEIAKKVTVNTTELFRDPAVWIALRRDMLPKLAQKPIIRIWHAGCSSGQEVYSMIILLNELGILDKAEIYASDLNTDIIQVAQQGLYKYRFNICYFDNFDKVIRNDVNNPLIIKDIPYEKYFEIDILADKMKVRDEFLKKPIFSKFDLVKDVNPLDIKYDLILCRNVMIYFNYILQNKIFQLFHDNLTTDGYFMLGIHESILGPFATKFEKRGYYYIKK